MSKVNVVAILASIREVANSNGENKTAEYINRVLEEIRK